MASSPKPRRSRPSRRRRSRRAASAAPEPEPPPTISAASRRRPSTMPPSRRRSTTTRPRSKPPPGRRSTTYRRREAPSLVPPMRGHARLGETAAASLDAEEMESFAARRERLRARRETKRRSSRWTAIILVLVAFNVALVGARNEVVRYLPQTASLFAAIGLPVNLRNLKFENVKISKESENGVTTLIVDGTIVSDRQHLDRSAAAALLRAQRRPARKSTPGPRCPRAACSSRARSSNSTAGSPRRRPTPPTCWCASSTPRTPPPATERNSHGPHPDRRRRRGASAGWCCARSARTATS